MSRTIPPSLLAETGYHSFKDAGVGTSEALTRVLVLVRLTLRLRRTCTASQQLRTIYPLWSTPSTIESTWARSFVNTHSSLDFSKAGDSQPLNLDSFLKDKFLPWDCSFKSNSSFRSMRALMGIQRRSVTSRSTQERQYDMLQMHQDGCKRLTCTDVQTTLTNAMYGP